MSNLPPTKREPAQTKLLQAVTTEVEGRLAQSLHNAVGLTLGIDWQANRIQRPWSATVAQPAQPSVPLAAGTRIIEVFDRPDLNRQLLILGEPGAGKTTMMLELAQDLLGRSTRDNTEPIPVPLSLSAWKDPQQPLFDWLVAELKAKYGIRPDLAQRWLKDHHLLPLLDGLDEVAPQHQQACVVALNAWLTGDVEQRPSGVLICCRREEFEQVVRQPPLSLYGAIHLQRLNPAQIQAYFNQLGLQTVGQTVLQDAVLRSLLTTPLFLSMFGLVQTQQTFSIADWQSRPADRKIEYLLDTYWLAAIERPLIADPRQLQQGISSKIYGTKPLPTPKAVRRSLIFAAKWLDQDASIELTDLLIEKLQPAAALLTLRQEWAYRLTYGLIWGLIGGVIFGLIFGLIWGVILGVRGLIDDIKTRIEPHQRIKNSTQNMFIVSAIVLTVTILCKILLEPLLSSTVDLLESLLSRTVDPKQLRSLVICLLFSLIGFSFQAGNGEALTQHLALRLVLAGCRYVPWRYDLFLNYCTERLMLQRIGGRYRFMHKLLQDHFAQMDLEP